MPVILFSIDGVDNSSGAFQRASASLNSLGNAATQAATRQAALDRAMTATAAASAQVDSAAVRVQAAALRQGEAMAKAAEAATRYRTAMNDLNGATGDTSALQARAASAFDAMAGAQIRAAESGVRLADSYTRLATAQDLATRNEEKLRAAMNAPMKGATGGGSGGAPGTGGSGGGSALGGAVKNVVLYGLAYQLGSDLMNQVTQGFTRALSTSRTLSMTGATTGITPAVEAQLGTYVNQLAGSGTQPYTSDILATGLYAIPSAGVTDPAAIKAINKEATQFSAFSGATDTLTANNALIQTMAAYGVNQKQMATQAVKFQDAITGAVNLGIVLPSEVAPSVTTFGSAAAQARIPFTVAAGLFAASTYTTRSSQQSAQDENAFIRQLIGPNVVQKTAARLLGVTNLLGQGGAGLLASDPNAYFSELSSAVKLNPNLDLGKLYGQTDAASFAMGMIGPGGANLGRTRNVLAAVGTPGTTEAANARYQASPAAKFDNAVASFKTAEQQFAAAAIPLATALVHFATSDVLKPLTHLVQHPGQPVAPRPTGPAVAPLPYVRPTSGEGSRSPLGLAIDQVNWLKQHAPQALSTVEGWFPGSAHATPPRTLPANFVGPLTLDERRAPVSILPSNFIGPLAPGMARATTTLPSTFVGPLAPGETRATLAGPPAPAMGGGGPTYVPPPFDQHAAQVASMQAAYAAGQVGAEQARRQALFDATYGVNALVRGGANKPPDVTAAQQRLTQAIGDNTGRNTVESAFGLYRQAVNANVLLTPGAKSTDILAQQGKVQRYERGLSGGPDEGAITAAQMNLDAAQQMGDMPDKLKVYQDAYLAAERQFYRDTQSGTTLAKSLRQVDQQGQVYTAQNQQIDLSRGIKDLNNRIALDKLTGNTGDQSKAELALLAYQRANAGPLKLDASDLALLKAQTHADLLAVNPVVDTRQFYQKNAGLGAFQASEGSTLVRSGGIDPQTQEIRILQRELAAANNTIAGLLGQIVKNTGVRAQAGGSTSSQRGHRSSTAP